MFPQIFFGRGFFWNLFGRDFSAKFVWLRVPLHRLFGGELFFRCIWVEFYIILPDLQLFFGRDVLSGTFGGFVHFLWWFLWKIALCRLLFREFVVDVFRPIFF